MATWILRLDDDRRGVRVAIKDLIDVAGAPTTAAYAAVAATATAAAQDAECLAGLRAAGVVIIGKTNLHELAFGGTGVNAAFGTPVNPFDPACIPGGSSSGNAVALAHGEVDIAIGTDTAGSIRTPSACCGTAGLKTTWGRVSTIGVWPLAPSLDSIGPMARDVGGLVDGMALLEPGFAVGATTTVIGRVRLPGVDPNIETAIDNLLAAAEITVIPITLPGWDAAIEAGRAILQYEAWQQNGPLYDHHRAGLSPNIQAQLRQAQTVTRATYREALVHRTRWRSELAAAFQQAPVLGWPSMVEFPPRIDAPTPNTRRSNIAVNLAGHPSLALPIPAVGRFPASLQLVGPDDSEDRLCGTGLVLEAAAATVRSA